MNTKIKTTALVCAALFAVTACSSNGESGPDINPTNPITPTKPDYAYDSSSTDYS